MLPSRLPSLLPCLIQVQRLRTADASIFYPLAAVGMTAKLERLSVTTRRRNEMQISGRSTLKDSPISICSLKVFQNLFEREAKLNSKNSDHYAVRFCFHRRQGSHRRDGRRWHEPMGLVRYSAGNPITDLPSNPVNRPRRCGALSQHRSRRSLLTQFLGSSLAKPCLRTRNRSAVKRGK